MNPYDFAMQMEKDGEAYYRELAEKTSDAGLKSIWNRLADDERKHYTTFKEMKAGEEPQMAGTTILEDAKNIFKQMKAENAPQSLELSEEGLYEKALEIEKRSEEFYRLKAKEAEKPNRRDLFLKIAEEEKKHYFLVDNILEFMRAPRSWLENAEFNHLGNYGA